MIRISRNPVVVRQFETATAEQIVRIFRDAVNVKRAGLLAAGTDVEVTGYGVVALQGRPDDQTLIQGLAFGAQLRLGLGDSATQMPFLDRANVLHLLTPVQMIEVWRKGAAFVSVVYRRSWVIKTMDPILTDLDEQTLWSEVIK